MKRRTLITIVVLGIVVAGGSVFGLQKAPHESSVIQSAAGQARFPLYVPTSLPAGYSLDPASLSLTSEALLVSAHNEDNKNVIFTEQPVPKEFDFEAFYNKQLVGAQDIASIYGRGKAGIFDGEMSGSLVTDSTWIIIKGPKDMPAIDMKLIIEGLKPVSPRVK